jgi:hypothetical protein
MSASGGTLRARLALGLSLGACAAAAFWISEGVAPWDGDRLNVWHQYEYMAEGFLSGHTYLSLEPSPELLSLKDPFDPRQNAPFRLWDASLYHGKYYLYYGPAPAVVLMVPWRAVTGHVLPQRLAVAAFAAAGLAGLSLLLWEVRNRHFPRLSAFALAGILVVAFHASWLPVTLRRSGMWELPIVSATACLWWALYFLWKFHDSGGRARWAIGIGASLAVMMGCRATYVFPAGAVAALAFARESGRGLRLWPLRRSALAAAGLAVAGGVALLLYNHARFGRWLEFGQSYQLWGMDERHSAHFSLGYAPFNIRVFFFSLPSLGPYFPFLHPYWPDAFPRGYISIEEMYGVLFMLPVHLAGLAALGWAWRSRPAAAGIVLAASAAASVLAALTLVCWAGACSRYITELLGGWTVVTSIGLMAVIGSDAGPRAGRLPRILAAAAACWTIACVWLASAEFRGFMKQTNPRTYAALARALDYPSAWWAEREGIRFGPENLAVRVAPSPDGLETVLVASGRPQRVNQLLLGRVEGGKAQLILAENEHHVLETPLIPAPGGRLVVRVDAPWLYPPAESPFWDSVADPAERLDRQTLFAVQWDSGGVRTHSVLSADATAFEPAVRGPGTPDAPCVESVSPAAQAP